MLINIFETLGSLSKDSEITLITTNCLIDISDENIYVEKAQNNNIKNFYIIPFYHSKKKQLFRSIGSIIKTHFFLKKIQKNINFQDFDLCISDGKFFIWQRIILDKFLSNSCVTVGLGADGVLLPLNKFKDLIEGQPAMEIVKSLHKLRQPMKIKKKNSYKKKIINVYTKLKDIFLDRIILSKFFYGRNFKYDKLDFNLLETKQFDYRISFFYSSYFFWDKIYQNKRTFWAKIVSKCKCKTDTIKDKALFISTLLSNYGNENDVIKNVDKTIVCLEKLILKFPNVNQIDFKFHPFENEKNINLVKEKTKNLGFVKINFLDNKISLNNVACNYKCVLGVMSGALLYLKNFCKNIDVYCLKNLSEKFGGEYFYLKLINEQIKIYDDESDFFKDEMISSEDYYDLKKHDFNDIVFSLLSKSSNITK